MGKSKKREYSSESTNSSEEEERIKRHNKKHKKKSKKSKHKKSKRRSSTSSNSSNEEEWVVKNVDEKKKSPEIQAKRDDWMSAENFFLPTFSREKTEKKVAPEKEKLPVYDPATSSRELNPYFKTGEGGLPSFQRPRDDDDDDDYYSRSSRNPQPVVKQNWKKSQQPEVHKRSRSPSPSIQLKPDKPSEITKMELLTPSDFLTDEQMNSIGAKMLKAEMMGKTKLAAELKEKLEKAKEYRKNNPKGSRPRQTEDDDNKVVLSLPTSSGMNRPIKQSDVRDSRHSDKKQKKKRVETHEGGERTRYYPDDGKYDIKTMFEREKYSDGRDQDIEFAKAISKVKDSQQMDMADIFSDTIRKDKQPKSDERDEAIREAKRLEKVLESCYKCFDSPKMNKDLIVHVGKYIYVAIPYHERLVNHHLIISPIQHIPCTTMIDEEVWEEFKNYKKALTRFFFDKKEDVVFFETVKYLHRRPHMEVQMMSSKDFEMIQFYFKKAIQESEQLTMNKKLIDIKGDKNIRSSIPRGMPYFWIDFGHTGMAHVIEDQESFPSNFAQEIIGGMLNVDVRKFRKPRKEYDPAKNVKFFSSLLKNVFENL